MVLVDSSRARSASFYNASSMHAIIKVGICNIVDGSSISQLIKYWDDGLLGHLKQHYYFAF